MTLGTFDQDLKAFALASGVSSEVDLPWSFRGWRHHTPFALDSITVVTLEYAIAAEPAWLPS